jgi:hypothetical protein
LCVIFSFLKISVFEAVYFDCLFVWYVRACVNAVRDAGNFYELVIMIFPSL